MADFNPVSLRADQLALLATTDMTLEQVLKIPAKADATPEPKLEDKPEPKVDATPEPKPEPKAKVEGDSVKAYLQEQNASLHAEVTTLKAATANLTGQLTQAKADANSMLAIVRGSVSNMSVAMNGRAGVADTMDATQALAEHARLEVEFKKMFPVGKVSATTAKTQDDKPSSADDSLFLQSVKAAPRGF